MTPDEAAFALCMAIVLGGLGLYAAWLAVLARRHAAETSRR